MKTFTSDQIAIIMLSSMPSEEDLTLVGGRALEYWVNIYSKSHPDLFKDIKGIPTRDLDFVITSKKAIEGCIKAWKLELSKIGAELEYDIAGIDDHTPEIAHTSVKLDPTADIEDRWFMTDFLFDLKGISSREIMNGGRSPLGDAMPIETNHFVLNEYMCMANRAFNVAQIRGKQDLKGITQLKQSMMVNKAYLTDLLDIGTHDSIREALKHVKKIKQLTLNKDVGLELIKKQKISLIDSIPQNHKAWPNQFKEKHIPQINKEITKRLRNNDWEPSQK